jgi:hypothetical protein
MDWGQPPTGEPAFDDPNADDPDESGTDEPYEECGASDDLPTGERFDESDYPQLTTMAPRADELGPLPDDLADLIAACLSPPAAPRPNPPALLRALEPIAKLPPRERRHG